MRIVKNTVQFYLLRFLAFPIFTDSRITMMSFYVFIVLATNSMNKTLCSQLTVIKRLREMRPLLTVDRKIKALGIETSAVLSVWIYRVMDKPNSIIDQTTSHDSHGSYSIDQHIIPFKSISNSFIL